MKCFLGFVVASVLASIPSFAHADDCVAGGRKLDGKGRHADAIAAWKACLATTPDDATLEGEIGAAAFQMHDLDVAEKFARAAITHAKDPSLKAGVLYTLGRVQEERKDKKAAIASYTESLTLRASPVVRGRLVALDPKAPIPLRRACRPGSRRSSTNRRPRSRCAW
jgi:tetratricopeptide (TPR) repeat protein